MKCLVTGGAGFVGSSLPRRYPRTDSDPRIAAFDNPDPEGHLTFEVAEPLNFGDKL